MHEYNPKNEVKIKKKDKKEMRSKIEDKIKCVNQAYQNYRQKLSLLFSS